MKIKSLERNGQCPICRGTGKIPTTDWLTKGMTEEEIAREKEESLADIVEVVRCKDCKHLTVINIGGAYARCEKTGYVFWSFRTDTREHFCAYGERREQ